MNDLNLNVALEAVSNLAAELKQERDEARHEIEGWRNKWECAVTMGAMAENERDEARKLASALHEDQTKLIMERDELREQFSIARETLRLIAEEGGQTEGRTIIPDGTWCAKQAQYTLDNPK